MGQPVVHYEVVGREIVIELFSDPEGHVIGLMSERASA